MEDLKQFFLNAELLPVVSGWAVKLVVALVIYIVGKWIAGLLNRSLVKLMQVRAVEPTLVTFLSNIVYAALLVAVILAALDTLGLPITSLLAIVGAAGLAVGLAMKDSLSNFAAGVMLVMFRPFSKGHFIEAAGVTGKVEEIHIFNTAADHAGQQAGGDPQRPGGSRNHYQLHGQDHAARRSCIWCRL